MVTPYVAEVSAQFHFPRRIRVVFDAGNGTGGPVMHRLLERLNVDATEMFFEMDGRFPNHHPDPTVPENLQALIDKVRESGADLGIAFDGDTDRIGAVDDQGTIVWGDQLMIIYGREILTRKPGATFIGEVKCSQLMYDDLKARGGNPIMWKTGHSLIKAKMKETHAELAGEMSGHIFFADRYYGFDDALYSACRLIEIVANSGRPLSAPAGRPAHDRDHARNPFRLSRRAQVRRGQRGDCRLARPASNRGRGWRARALPPRLGPGARLQHPARAGHALRSHHSGTASGIPARN